MHAIQMTLRDLVSRMSCQNAVAAMQPPGQDEGLNG